MNVQEFMPILNGISNKIDGVSAIVWQAAVKNAQLSFYTDMIWGCSLVLFCIVVMLVGTFILKYDDDDSANVGLWVLNFLVSFILLCMGLSNITDAIKEKMNPEYYAIKEIAHMVKQ